MTYEELFQKIEKGDYRAPDGTYDRNRDEYRRLNAEGREAFKADLFEHLGITGHPKAEELWRLAWEEGHSSGYNEVLGYAQEFVDLLDVPEWTENWPQGGGKSWFHGIRWEGDTPATRLVNHRGPISTGNGGTCTMYTCEGQLLYAEEGAKGVWTPVTPPVPPFDVNLPVPVREGDDW